MKFLAHYKRLFIITFFSCVVMSPLLTSCGGDTTTAGIGGTGITQGKITGFGSIFVNGIEFDTNQSQFIVDGDATLNEDDLAIGMVVNITGSVSNDGLEGTAVNVEYDDEVQGPVENITIAVNGQRSFDIFDKTITIDESTTSFDKTDFTTIKDNDIVEISGFTTSTTGIEATFVKKTGDITGGNAEVEIKGTIEKLSLTQNTFELTGTGIIISIDSETEVEVPGGVLSNGLFVEVEGDFQNATSILAKEIEIEDEGFEDGNDISLQGVISNFVSISDFTINGQTVDASNALLSPANTQLANGTNVEVGGNIVDGVLNADEVELREGEVKIKATVFGVNLNDKQIEFTFPPTPGSILVTTDNQTEFEDETGGSIPFSLSQVKPGDFIKIEGIDTESQIIANQVRRLNPAGVEVQGEVEFFTGTTSIDSITLFGVTFEVDTGVVNPGLNIGDIVEIKDDDADGKIDQIELED